MAGYARLVNGLLKASNVLLKILDLGGMAQRSAAMLIPLPYPGASGRPG